MGVRQPPSESEVIRLTRNAFGPADVLRAIRDLPAPRRVTARAAAVALAVAPLGPSFRAADEVELLPVVDDIVSVDFIYRRPHGTWRLRIAAAPSERLALAVADFTPPGGGTALLSEDIALEDLIERFRELAENIARGHAPLTGSPT